MTATLCPRGHGAMVLMDPYRSAWGEHYGCPVCFCGTVVLSTEGRKRNDALSDSEVRRFVNEDHRRRGGTI
jgi:hypothetical protein